jgi:hypothetical protein
MNDWENSEWFNLWIKIANEKDKIPSTPPKDCINKNEE